MKQNILRRLRRSESELPIGLWGLTSARSVSSIPRAPDVTPLQPVKQLGQVQVGRKRLGRSRVNTPSNQHPQGVVASEQLHKRTNLQNAPNPESRLGEDQEHHYFCRGCGRPLPPGSRAQFHKECLRADKRHRVREQRRLEERLFKVWLRKQICSKCGAGYVDHHCDGAMESSCEALQPAVERDPPD